jgi:hypothetical protein
VSRISVDKLVDRHDERDEFLNMIEFTSEAKLLMIDVGEGTGKTDLLRILQSKCVWKNVPVALVDLETATVTDAFTLVSELRDQFGDRVPFDRFDRARIPLPPGAQLEGKFVAPGSTISGGKNAGTYIENLYLQPGELDAASRRKSVTAFFDDLRQFCKASPLAMLLDSFEKRQPGLNDWIPDEFLRLLAFDANCPEKLVIGIAGKGLPDFAAVQDAKLRARISSRKALTWRAEHVPLILVVNGYDKFDEEEIQYLTAKLVGKGMSIRETLMFADRIKQG